MAKRRRALLADEPGVGKTLQAIMAADEIGARWVLVLCPGSMTDEWAAAWATFQTVQRPIAIWRSKLPPASDPAGGVLIASYDRLIADKRGWTKLRAQTHDVVILDEAHVLRNLTAKRTRAVYGQHAHGDGLRADYWWLLTGTPTPNYVHELFTHLRALWPDVISLFGRPMTQDQFRQAFCVLERTAGGMRVRGNNPTAVAELRRRMAPHILRRTRRQVFPDMPPVRYVQTRLAVDPDRIDWQAVLPEQIGRPPTDEQELLDWLQANFAHLSSLREALGRAKADAAAELATATLDGGEDKLVLFCQHTAVIERLADRLRAYRPLVLDGRVPQPKRHNIVRTFQDVPQHRVFIGQITAAGTGITLTASATIFLVEASWIPFDNFQCIGRVARRGQTRPVIGRFLSVPRSLDDRIMSAVVHKLKASAPLWGSTDFNRETGKR